MNELVIFLIYSQFYLHSIINMGNKNIEGLSFAITKNWQPIFEGGDVYQNTLTHQTVRQQVGKVENSKKIQDLKLRMKEKNPYVCRVVFYSHYIHNLYHIYTQENRNKPMVKNLAEWQIHQTNVISAFKSLAERYGPTRVCREMIGVDNNGQIKIWINPNTALCQVLCPCESDLMLADIQSILDQITRQSGHQKTLKHCGYSERLKSNYLYILNEQKNGKKEKSEKSKIKSLKGARGKHLYSQMQKAIGLNQKISGSQSQGSEQNYRRTKGSGTEASKESQIQIITSSKYKLLSKQTSQLDMMKFKNFAGHRARSFSQKSFHQLTSQNTPRRIKQIKQSWTSKLLKNNKGGQDSKKRVNQKLQIDFLRQMMQSESRRASLEHLDMIKLSMNVRQRRRENKILQRQLDELFDQKKDSKIQKHYKLSKVC